MPALVAPPLLTAPLEAAASNSTVMLLLQAVVLPRQARTSGSDRIPLSTRDVEPIIGAMVTPPWGPRACHALADQVWRERAAGRAAVEAWAQSSGGEAAAMLQGCSFAGYDVPRTAAEEAAAATAAAAAALVAEAAAAAAAAAKEKQAAAEEKVAVTAAAAAAAAAMAEEQEAAAAAAAAARVAAAAAPKAAPEQEGTAGELLSAYQMLLSAGAAVAAVAAVEQLRHNHQRVLEQAGLLAQAVADVAFSGPNMTCWQNEPDRLANVPAALAACGMQPSKEWLEVGGLVLAWRMMPRCLCVA